MVTHFDVMNLLSVKVVATAVYLTQPSFQFSNAPPADLAPFFQKLKMQVRGLKGFHYSLYKSIH